MTKTTVDRQFLNWLLENTTNLSNEKIKVKGPGERKPHIRFSSGCGLSSRDEFLKLFKSLNLPFEQIHTEDFSKTYDLGGYVKWRGNSIGVLFGVAKDGNAERKKYAPDSLGLAGYKTAVHTELRSKIIAGLTAVEQDVGFRNCLVSILDNVETKTSIEDHPFLQQNINKIKSDFGEVLAAYMFCLKGCEIEFPNNSNNPGIDFKADGHPYSVKAPNGGGKVNLKDYKDSIPQATNTGKFLHSIATHNRDDFFKYAALLSPEVQTLAEWVGGTTREAVKKYVASCSYDEHYAKMKADARFTVKNQTLGIPENSNQKATELTPRELWASGSLEPFDFTLNTIINRCWGEKNSTAITAVVSGILTNATFIHVDIKDLNIVTKITPFENVSTWKTVYWSRATKAWHNWMAVEPTKETE